MKYLQSKCLRLTPETAQGFDEIEVKSLIEKVTRERPTASTMSLETLALRQEITEKVMAACLDVDSVNADIDLETEQIRSIRSELQSRRDKRKSENTTKRND